MIFLGKWQVNVYSFFHPLTCFSWQSCFFCPVYRTVMSFYKGLRVNVPVPMTPPNKICRAKKSPDFFGSSLPVRKPKTSDFFEVKFRCFASKVRRFASKKSGVLHFRSLLSPEKVLCFSPAFLHQSLKGPLFIGYFGWRIGCRIQAWCRMNPALSVLFILFLPLLGPQNPAFSNDSVSDTA